MLFFHAALNLNKHELKLKKVPEICPERACS